MTTETPTADEQLGMTWWNGMTEVERLSVLRQANTLTPDASAADAWRLWKANRISMRPDQERWIMVKATDNHVIRADDSIDRLVMSHRGLVAAPELACNVPNAVGKIARHYNVTGRQVWTGKSMPIRNGKIVRDTTPPPPHPTTTNQKENDE